MIGKTILHYRIIEKLGEGGMGVVYKAEDTKLKRDVAIKFLPRQIAVSDEERERFKLEAQAAAVHPYSDSGFFSERCPSSNPLVFNRFFFKFVAYLLLAKLSTQYLQ